MPPALPLTTCLMPCRRRMHGEGSPKGNGDTGGMCHLLGPRSPSGRPGLAVRHHRCPCQQPGSRAELALGAWADVQQGRLPARCRAEEAEEGRGPVPRTEAEPSLAASLGDARARGAGTPALPAARPPLQSPTRLPAPIYGNSNPSPDVGPSPAKPLEQRRHGARQPRTPYPRRRSLPQRRPRQLLI